MNDDLRQRLEEAGRREVPPLGDGFAEELQGRLLAVASSLPAPAGETGAPAPPPRRPSPRWLLAGFGAALAVVLVAVLAGVPRQAPEVTYIPVAALDQPVHVEVVLPGGEVLEDPDGLLLPPGAIVRVGEGGSARIGETVLAPGDVATVEEDRVLVERASPLAVVSAPTPAPTRRPAAPGGGTPVPSSPPQAGVPSPSGPPDPTPAPSPTTARSPGGDPTTAPTRAPAATPEATQAATATPSPTPSILRPRLRARLIDGPRIAVTWTETWRAKSYVLVASLSRTGPASDPAYPGSRVLGEFITPPERRLRYRVPAGVVEVKLQVFALRGNGTVLRRSQIVTILIPRASASPGGDLTGDGPTPDPVPGALPDPDPSTGP